MSDEVDFIVCLNCDTPCYFFEYDAKKGIVSAFCEVCANDDPLQFRPPSDDEVEE